MFTAWASLILFGIAGVFAYHVGLGWRTGVVRFPMSILVFQEFQKEESPENFWGIMALDAAVSIAALVASAFVAWDAIPFSKKPIDQLQSLNGCYEGQGLPDFMRPRSHWTFRVNDGRIIDGAGTAASNMTLHHDAQGQSSVTFSPGIRISMDDRKVSFVERGDTVEGQAFLSNNRSNIILTNDWGDQMQTTSCG